MIKRAIAVCFVFIAGFLLLANNVIPHHHHSSSICFQYSHCLDERTHGKNNHSNHQHDGNNDCCSLNSAVILPATNGTEDSIISLNTGSHQNTSDFMAIIPYNNGIYPIFIFSPYDPPGTSSLFSVYVNSSLGLRAPPVV